MNWELIIKHFYLEFKENGHILVEYDDRKKC